MPHSTRVHYEYHAPISRSCNISCPSLRQSWRQLEQDLWRMETWLDHARAILRSQGSSPPANMEQLEDSIQSHREFLLDLDSHKNLIMSVNLVGGHLSERPGEDQEKVSRMKRRLEDANAAWDEVCEQAAKWQTKLQTALLEVSFCSACFCIGVYMGADFLLHRTPSFIAR